LALYVHAQMIHSPFDVCQGNALDESKGSVVLRVRLDTARTSTAIFLMKFSSFVFWGSVSQQGAHATDFARNRESR
jgi:hypothetical protein